MSLMKSRVGAPRSDERPHLGAGQQVHPFAQAGEVFGQYGIQLVGMTEGELPQQRSHR
jgi:hypothetical protein